MLHGIIGWFTWQWHLKFVSNVSLYSSPLYNRGLVFCRALEKYSPWQATTISPNALPPRCIDLVRLSYIPLTLHSNLSQGSADFFCKGPESILGFWGHTVCVTATQLHCCTMRAAMPHTRSWQRSIKQVVARGARVCWLLLEIACTLAFGSVGCHVAHPVLSHLIPNTNPQDEYYFPLFMDEEIRV